MDELEKDLPEQAEVENEVLDTEGVDTTDSDIDSDVSEESTVQEEVAEPIDWSDKIPKKFLDADGNPDIERLAKSYQSLSQKLGEKGIAAPEAIDDYVYEPTLIGEGQSKRWDDESENVFKEEALNAGLSTDQYAFVMSRYEAVVEAFSETQDKARETLQTEWKGKFDQNINYAKEAFDAFAPDDISINEVGNNPLVIKLLAAIGAQMGEDKTTRKTSSSKPAPKGIDDHRAELREAMKSGDYYRHPDRYEALRKGVSK